MSRAVLHCGDVREVLASLPERSVQCVCTSPPFWGLRDYGTATWQGGTEGCDHVQRRQPQSLAALADRHAPRINPRNPNRQDDDQINAVAYRDLCGKCGAIRTDRQLGLERTPEEYVANMVAVFREVKRVLRDDGLLFLNLGDSYLPNKQLAGIPWLVAKALQKNGWTLRSDIVWGKPNPMPESVQDRPTRSHEYVFMFCKSWGGEPRFGHISDEDARWLALFLDTEGSVVCKRTESGGKTIYGAQLCFAGSCRPLLETAHRIIGHGTILKRPGTNADMYYLQLSNRRAADLLHRVYPYLIVKQRQAALGVYLQSVLADGEHERRTKVGRLRGRCRADNYTELLERIWLTMKDLNHFGTPDVSWVPVPDLFLLTKSERYYYDSAAIAEDSEGTYLRAERERSTGLAYSRGIGHNGRHDGAKALTQASGPTRNARSVWTIATQPYPAAHFATFPEELARRCILAGSSNRACEHCGAPWERVTERVSIGKSYATEKSATKRGDGLRTAFSGYDDGSSAPVFRTTGWRPTCACENTGSAVSTVLDPFGGSGTVASVATGQGRAAIYIDLNPAYLELARQRIGPMLVDVA